MRNLLATLAPPASSHGSIVEARAAIAELGLSARHKRECNAGRHARRERCGRCCVASVAGVDPGPLGEPHRMSNDLNTFVAQAQHRLQTEYDRIQSRRKLNSNGNEVLEDPGTAGDQGEANWAHLIREWLPSTFTVTTKGRIVFPNGKASPQIDVIVLAPSYPSFLIERNDKYYLSSGVAAAFECKITGALEHIGAAFRTNSDLASEYRRTGLQSPHTDLNSLPFGILCHTFRGNKKREERWRDIFEKLADCTESANGPRSLLDFVCIADTACWGVKKFISLGPNEAGVGTSGVRAGYYSDLAPDPDAFIRGAKISELAPPEELAPMPVGRFLVSLLCRLARDFPEMRDIASHLNELGIKPGGGRVSGGPTTVWALEQCLSSEVLQQLREGKDDREFFGAWSRVQGA